MSLAEGVFAFAGGAATGAATATGDLIEATSLSTEAEVDTGTGTGAAALTGAAGALVLIGPGFTYTGFNKLSFILSFNFYIIV